MLTTLEPIPGGYYVTPHFLWSELSSTDSRDPSIHAQQANPPLFVRVNVRRLTADHLEPARAVVGRLRVNSGYRCPALNAAIPGSSKTSAHMDGLAADVYPLDMDIFDAYSRLAKSGIRFDQLIFEYGRWIHIGAARDNREPRGQLLAIYTPGSYELWDPNDYRFVRRSLA